MDEPEVPSETTAVNLVSDVRLWVCIVVLKEHTSRQIVYFGRWNNTSEITDSTVTTVCERCECKGPVSTATEFLYLLQGVADESVRVETGMYNTGTSVQ